MLSQTGLEKFEFLRKLALQSGAADAKVIPADKIVIEDRVVLKCKVGCANYGKTLACPPYTPTAEEFRKIVNEYSYALFMKFKSHAEADPDIAKIVSKTETDQTVPQEMKEKAQKFWSTWKSDKRKMLTAVVDLEKAAMNKGYTLAIAFVSGPCYLCNLRPPDNGAIFRRRCRSEREKNREERWHHSHISIREKPRVLRFAPHRLVQCRTHIILSMA
jgi:predicted metal-binding protein